MPYQSIVNQLSSWGHGAIIFRLTFALIAGMTIGIDREMKRRGAGIKTHVLVCLGSTLVIMTSEYIYRRFGGGTDLSRLGAQVISGVGFLGVGTIMVTGRNQVRGLTTAAGLWACACIGLAIGIGFVEGAAICLLLVLLTLKLITKLDVEIYQHSKVFDLYLEFDTSKNVSVFVREMRQRNIKIQNMELNKPQLKGEGPTALITLETSNGRSYILNTLHELKCVQFAEEL